MCFRLTESRFLPEQQRRTYMLHFMTALTLAARRRHRPLNVGEIENNTRPALRRTHAQEKSDNALFLMLRHCPAPS